MKDTDQCNPDYLYCGGLEDLKMGKLNGDMKTHFLASKKDKKCFGNYLKVNKIKPTKTKRPSEGCASLKSLIDRKENE